jgi:hypothetical protein
VVVGDIITEKPLKMAFVEDDDVIQTPLSVLDIQAAFGR